MGIIIVNKVAVVYGVNRWTPLYPIAFSAGNLANANGGGVFIGTMFNCALIGQFDARAGGGTFGSALYDAYLADQCQLTMVADRMAERCPIVLS